MTTLSLTPTATAGPITAGSTTTGRVSRLLGGFFIAEALLSFAPVVVLGAAIGWPASLDNPAAQQLAAVAAAPDGVRLGYGLYLLYSIAVAPLLLVLAARTWGSLAHPAAATVAVFAGLSALARAVGILRWLTVMPVLASAHAAADPGVRAGIELTFTAVHEWGGGIGEILGVSLFMALAMAGLAAGAWQRRTMPRPLALLGAVSALALLLLALPVVGAPEWMPVALAVSLLSAWMLAVGIALMWRRG
jgi:Domain of unknown function (DUF4386)